MPRIRENVVEGYLLSRCREVGFLCLKFTSPARGGVPDRIVVTPAATVFVEMKRPGESPDPRQLATHNKMRRFGALVYVVNSRIGVDTFIHELAELSSNRAL